MLQHYEHESNNFNRILNIYEDNFIYKKYRSHISYLLSYSC